MVNGIDGLWGRKIGMTQIFSDNNKVVPVTVIDTAQWYVARVKTKERDGYCGIQIACVKKSHAEKSFTSEWLRDPKRYFSVIKELRCTDETLSFVVGQKVELGDFLLKGDTVDVFGITIGRGFQGGVKRHGFRGGRGSHGDKLGRGPGSLSFMRSRGRVIKGQRMAGHMGTERTVMKNLEIVKVEPASQVILVKGSVPGKSGSLVFVRKHR
jgi:large subunit ribosomal protein L3